MGRNRNNNKGKKTYSQNTTSLPSSPSLPVVSPKTSVPSSTEWDRLIEDPELQQAFISLTDELSRAQTAAEARAVTSSLPVNQVLDLRRALSLLDAHPPLIRYLNGVREREEAIRSAMSLSEQDFLLRSRSSTGSGRPTAQQEHTGGGWVWGQANKPIGITEARQIRDWADRSTFVRIAIQKMRRWVERADIAIVPMDETRPYNRKVLKAMEDLLTYPNEFLDSHRSLIGPVAEDVLVLDSGALEKNMTLSRQPVALYYQDGATIKIYPNWSGDPNEPRYLYDPGGQSDKKPLRNDELILISEGVSSWRYRYSRVQYLRDEIEADLKATRSALRMVEQKPPPHIVQLVNATGTQLDSVRAKYDSDFAGVREIFFMGGPEAAHVFPLIYSLKDQQWMEYQTYIARKMSTMFGMSPQSMGITFDVNRSTAETQQEDTENEGYIPFLLLFEEYWNRELLADFCPKGVMQRPKMEMINLRAIYPQVTEFARMQHAQRVVDMAAVALAGLPSMTLNQILVMRGEKPVGLEGDWFWVNTASGPMPWLGYNDALSGIGAVAMGGTLGSQDPAGGIDESGDSAVNFEEEEHASGDEREPAPDASGSTPPESGANTDTTTSWVPDHFTMARLDARQPGKTWSPSTALLRQQEQEWGRMLSRSQRRRLTPAQVMAAHLPDGKVRAQATLQAQVAQLFEQIEKEGREALLQQQQKESS